MINFSKYCAKKAVPSLVLPRDGQQRGTFNCTPGPLVSDKVINNSILVCSDHINGLVAGGWQI